MPQVDKRNQRQNAIHIHNILTCFLHSLVFSYIFNPKQFSFNLK